MLNIFFEGDENKTPITKRITASHLNRDRHHSEEEDRFVLLGLSSGLRLLVVCHCYRKNDEIIRIISARKATRKGAEILLEKAVIHEKRI